MKTLGFQVGSKQVSKRLSYAFQDAALQPFNAGTNSRLGCLRIDYNGALEQLAGRESRLEMASSPYTPTLPKSDTRNLLVVPIVHTSADLGQLHDCVTRVKRQQGATKATLKKSEKEVEAFWSTLQEAIVAWEIDFSKLIVFQDALPWDPTRSPALEHRVVSDLAQKNSRNHQLLMWLMDRGAKVVGTEDPQLLVEDYNLIKKLIETQLSDTSEVENILDSLKAQQQSLLRKRDEYIASRIGAVLNKGEVGIIFLGMLHRIESYLSLEIHVQYPFGKPSFTNF